MSLAFLLAWASLALTTGYWSLVRQQSLVNRRDNPRALLAYERIQRGRILDRYGAVLAETVYRDGEYVRLYPEPSAALVVGYESFRYGLGGIEAAADRTLRGEAGRDPVDLWWRHGLLGEAQIGRDVRLTLAVDQQRAAFSALAAARRAGAIVVVDPGTGDLLAMASSPTFDPARLETDFETFTADDNGPLVNRATLGLYPAADLLRLFPATTDLAAPPALPIQTRAAGPGSASLSPLQAALLAAAVAGHGQMPAPRLIAAIETLEGWQQQGPQGHPVAVWSRATADEARRRLEANFESEAAGPSLPLPGAAATVSSGVDGQRVGWFVGFAPDGSFAICVLLEGGTAAEAVRAGAAFVAR